MLHGTDNIILTFQQGLIVLTYVAFAVQLFLQTNFKKVQCERAIPIYALLSVFILCSISGYASYIFDFSVFTQIILHGFLVAAGVSLVVYNKNGVIAEMMNESSNI